MKKRKCVKGDPCGGSCISKGKTCKKNLPEAASVVLEKKAKTQAQANSRGRKGSLSIASRTISGKLLDSVGGDSARALARGDEASKERVVRDMISKVNTTFRQRGQSGVDEVSTFKDRQGLRALSSRFGINKAVLGG